MQARPGWRCVVDSRHESMQKNNVIKRKMRLLLMPQQMIVVYANNRKGVKPLYSSFCFPKQAFSLTKKISKPLSARLFQSRFFLTAPRRLTTRSVGGRRAVHFVPVVRYRDAPVFHYVATRVHGGRQQVLPMIAVPHGIDFEDRGRVRDWRRFFGSCLRVRVDQPRKEAANLIEQHGNLPNARYYHCRNQSSRYVCRAASRTNTY